MKKIMISILILVLLLVSACQKSAKKDIVAKIETPKVETPSQGETVVDVVGNDISTVDSIEKDIIDDSLSDLDSGLTEIQEI